jgi:hypothetical protein
LNFHFQPIKELNKALCVRRGRRETEREKREEKTLEKVPPSNSQRRRLACERSSEFSQYHRHERQIRTEGREQRDRSGTGSVDMSAVAVGVSNAPTINSATIKPIKKSN